MSDDRARTTGYPWSTHEVTDSSALLTPGQQPMYGLPRPPGVVCAAVVVTWIAATGTAVVTLLLTVGLLWLAAPIFDSFETGRGNPRWIVLDVATVVIALAVAADFVAVFVLRGRRWAQGVLLGLSLVAAIGGVSGYYIAPLAVTASAVAVVVLLLLRDSRAWFRARP